MMAERLLPLLKWAMAGLPKQCVTSERAQTITRVPITTTTGVDNAGVSSRSTMVSSTETAHGPYSVSDVDWQGRTTDTAVYTTAPTWSTMVGDDDYVAMITTARYNYSKTFYDDLGRVYKSDRYPGDSASSSHFQSMVYYDRKGRQVISSSTKRCRKRNGLRCSWTSVPNANGQRSDR